MSALNRPPISPPPYTGGCLCGAVRYTLSSRPVSINACHCDDCKKLSGATHLLMLTALAADFSHQGQTDVFAKKADSGRVVMIHRCAQCGTRLWHVPQLGPQYVLFAAGTLDDSSWAIPTTHIWTSRATSHERFEPDALIVEGQPPDRDGMIAAFKRIYG
jgi:hypothetical protein